MKYIIGFFQFWYDFIVGDDWTIAAGVIVALVLTALLAHKTTIAVWWLLPVAVVLGLSASLWRVAWKK
jgi:hypothetical protein